MLYYLIDDDETSRLIFEKQLEKTVGKNQLLSIPVEYTHPLYTSDTESNKQAEPFPTDTQSKAKVKLQSFSSAVSALTLIRKHFLLGNYTSLPDWIFLDIIMPGIDGWQFLDKLMELFRTVPSAKDTGIKVGVCLLTAYVNQYDLQRAQQYPLVKDCLLKPLTAIDLKLVTQI
ncbi:hypothetical protein QNI19_27220 [Cytophagaceae bacterium DM2B3-1]|uniref:Response regulatory domain-containing protein n=1 Tax=Xanthocytophaga flava TaxID=3048013 RepID=A0ABT7CSE3_9BACT|nr:hypothetical protein [Xanthocytophaga flavus]MDJ1496654.1 hypothetical protein [Xanthocytophaga flavus]